ncbi:MAG: M50 family metallopeptidase [Candidatus Shapirobacteria bacterium]
MDFLIFVIALSILVLVHEFGHFLAAVKSGIRVEEFGLGLPPKIIGKKIGKTIFSLNWLPIGGFCKLYGEDGSGKGGEAFNNKNPWQKLLVVVGGVLMNLLLAVAIFTVVYAVLGVPEETKMVKVVEVAKGSPAQMAGLAEGDWVMEVGGVAVYKPEELTTEVAKYKGESVKLKVYKVNKVEEEIEVKVRETPPEGEGAMGVAISNIEMRPMKWYEFYKGIWYGFKEGYYWGKIIVSGVFKMIGDLFMGKVPKDVAGPIGMFEATSSIRKSQGLLAVIHFFGIISVNLAVVNMLPFPALDGGRIIFVVYEILTKKKANQKFEATVNNIGMIILLSLILLIAVGDVAKLIK